MRLAIFVYLMYNSIMKCEKCNNSITEYTKYCLICKNPVKIAAQPLYLKQKHDVILYHIIDVFCSIFFLGIPYLLFWTIWVESSKSALNKINYSAEPIRYPAFLAKATIGLAINILVFLIWINIVGRNFDRGAISEYILVSLALFGFALTCWALCYFVVNYKIYKTLNFFLESNQKYINNQKFSLLASIILGQMYFQRKINYWHKYVKLSLLKPANMRKKYSRQQLAKYLLYFAILLVIFVPVIQKSDFWYAYMSKIDRSTSELATDTGMSIKGRALFYSVNPVATDKTNLDNDCKTKVSAELIEYGCFYVDQAKNPKIYLLNITDQDLKTVTEVTAAHEMLHNAYSLLSVENRANVDKMLKLNDLKLTTSGNQQYIKLISPYSSENESIRINEMHSLMAVMPIGALTPDLENYYKQYFLVDRVKLIEAEAKFNSTLLGVQARLDNIQNVISAQAKNLDEFTAVISQQRSYLNIYSYRGNAYSYNSLLPIYNSNIDKYNSIVLVYNQNVDLYNKSSSDFYNRLQGIQPAGITTQSQTKRAIN